MDDFGVIVSDFLATDDTAGTLIFVFVGLGIGLLRAGLTSHTLESD